MTKHIPCGFRGHRCRCAQSTFRLLLSPDQDVTAINTIFYVGVVAAVAIYPTLRAWISSCTSHSPCVDQLHASLSVHGSAAHLTLRAWISCTPHSPCMDQLHTSLSVRGSAVRITLHAWISCTPHSPCVDQVYASLSMHGSAAHLTFRP